MIYVIRHGQTDLNKEGRLQGRQGLPLNEHGIKQAEGLRDNLHNIKFDYAFSSPQERAVQTAEIAAGITVTVDERLNVFDLGEADRLKKGEVILNGAVPDSSIYKNVEEIQAFIQRVFHFMRELEEKNGQSNVHIALSGHRCTTGCIGAYFEGIPEDGNILRYSSDNGQYKVYRFRSTRD
ncbi:histidine phosphatase family protein [Paenibacillus sp. RC67]|uniref:histidine phosphatase family protein n=1 Tax=Paenibacillus sp. RC67 TaxID=3039392 RepID=UPI0024AD9FAA|nr:histidine phosphatase family protein [Paenibacillus sp. RC67]